MSDKRTILITGCSDGGLGSALALALQQKGWRVIASARNTAKLSVVQAARIEYIEMDVGSDESIATAVEQVRKLTDGTLDALVNNAGGGYSMPVLDADIDMFRNLFDLNVLSIVRVSKAFFPLLLKSDRDPMIVNNTSALGIAGVVIPFQGLYASSKAAASQLTESMRQELAPFNIRVINLLTGGIRTTFFQNVNSASVPTLPSSSIYAPARKKIEPAMVGDDGAERTDANVWARDVASDLSRAKPAYMIYRGATSSVARFGSHLPVGTFDGMFGRMAGVDVLERRIREEGGLEKLKRA